MLRGVVVYFCFRERGFIRIISCDSKKKCQAKSSSSLLLYFETVGFNTESSVIKIFLVAGEKGAKFIERCVELIE